VAVEYTVLIGVGELVDQRNVPWTLKYRPRSVDDVVDQDQAKKMFIPWIRQWISGATPPKKAALLYGPAGVGKTSLVEAVAREYGVELIEMNASDFRRKEDIERVARIAATQSGLFVRKKIILLDEVDGISGTADRGGIEAILELINVAKHPVVMTANDPWAQRLRPLREASLLVPFNRLSERHVVVALKRICDFEKVECEDKALRYIAQRSEGDLRSAINDLQNIAEGYGKVTYDIARSMLVSRDRQYSPWETLRQLFMSKYAWQARRAVTHADMDYDTLLQWINENIPVQYSDREDVWRAYEALSRADLMLGRIKHGASWDLLSYVFDMAGPGVALARRRSKFHWAKYNFPQKIAILAKTKEIREVREAVADAFSKRLLTSKKRFISEFLPFIKIIFTHNPEYAARIAASYNLTENMIRFLAGASHGKVMGYISRLRAGGELVEKGTSRVHRVEKLEERAAEERPVKRRRRSVRRRPGQRTLF